MHDDGGAPGFIDPMLLTSGTQLPSGNSWLGQLKMDGARGQLRVIGGLPSLRTRHGRRCDAEFPEIITAAAGLPDVILDGEVVILDADGAPDFAALRTRLGARPLRNRPNDPARWAMFYAFDIMWHNRSDLRELPLISRLPILDSLPLTGQLALVDTHPGQAAAILDFAKSHQLEGAVVKHAASVYRPGRSNTWLKFKVRRAERYWVTAWLPGDPGELDRYWVGRVVNGTIEPTGEVAYGLKPGQATALRTILQAASLASPEKSKLVPVAPVVAMTVESHGRTTGWLRDPVITSVEIEPSGP